VPKNCTKNAPLPLQKRKRSTKVRGKIHQSQQERQQDGRGCIQETPDNTKKNKGHLRRSRGTYFRLPRSHGEPLSEGLRLVEKKTAPPGPLFVKTLKGEKNFSAKSAPLSDSWRENLPQKKGEGGGAQKKLRHGKKREKLDSAY